MVEWRSIVDEQQQPNQLDNLIWFNKACEPLLPALWLIQCRLQAYPGRDRYEASGCCPNPLIQVERRSDLRDFKRMHLLKDLHEAYT